MKTSVYHGEDNVAIEYIFQKELNSDVLIVSFPGAVVEAGGQGFAWLLTLKEFHANILCVHSNPEYNKSKLTYRRGKPVIYNAVMAVIDRIIKEQNINKVIAVGSSMGGYAAMFYGLRNGWDVIAGSPPYAIDSEEAVSYTAGGTGPKAKIWVNDLMASLIKETGENGRSAKMFISFGEGESNWKNVNFGQKMVADLEAANVPYELKLYPFSDHNTVSRLFGPILKWKLKSFLGIEENAESEDFLPPRVKFMAAWENFIITFHKILNERDKSVSPCMGIEGYSYYASDNFWKTLHDFVHILHGWYWEPGAKTPLRMDHGDTYWRMATIRNYNTALSFQFQGSLMKYCEHHDDATMWEWLVNNVREYIYYLPALLPAPQKWNPIRNVVRRLLFLVSFHQVAAKKNTVEKWMALIPKEIDHCMDSLKERRADIGDRFEVIFLAFCLSKYYGNDAELYDKLSRCAYTFLNEYLEYMFDKNGVNIHQQARGQDALCSILDRVFDFIEKNDFVECKELKKIRRRYNKIKQVLAKMTRPDGIMTLLGDAVESKPISRMSDKERLSGNLILPDSNIAFLEDDKSLSYIVVNCGSNINGIRKDCDLLSFTWFYDGKQIFCNQGRCGADEDFKKYIYSPVAHNAFIVEGLDYVTPEYLDWTTIDDVKETDEYVTIVMSHHLIEGVELKRKLFWIKPNIIILVDEGRSNAQQKFTQNFLLDNFQTERANDDKVIVKVAPEYDVVISQQSNKEDISLVEYRGTESVSDTVNYRGSLVKKYDGPRKALNLAYTQMGNDVSFVTLIECHGSSKEARENERRVKDIRIKENNELVLSLFDE